MLTVVCGEDTPQAESQAESIAEAVLAAWPADRVRPEPRWLPMPSMVTRVRHEQGELPEKRSVQRRAAQHEVILIAVDDDTASRDLYKVVDGLHASHTPALIAAGDDRLPKLCDLRKSGVLVEPIGDHAGLARLLTGLLERQPIVRHLRQELLLSQHGAGGLSEAMNKLHDELQIANAVQREFIPSCPDTLGEFGFGVMYKPAGYVSGDIFEIEQLGEDLVGVFVADAVGHGVPAALLTLIISKSLPKTEGFGATERVLSPGEAIRRLNEEMVRRTGRSSRFATAIYATINTKTGEARLARAGHPAALLRREDGTVDELTPDGPLLGVFGGVEFEEHRFVIEPGEVLMMYSDGLESAFPDADAETASLAVPTGNHVLRLNDLLRAAAEAEDVGEAVTEFVELISQQTGSLHQADDLTTIVLKRALPAEAAVRRAEEIADAA